MNYEISNLTLNKVKKLIRDREEMYMRLPAEPNTDLFEYYYVLSWINQELRKKGKFPSIADNSNDLDPKLWQEAITEEEKFWRRQIPAVLFKARVVKLLHKDKYLTYCLDKDCNAYVYNKNRCEIHFNKYLDIKCGVN